MHRYPTRFATLNRSYFPADDEEYVPSYDANDDADSFEAYATTHRGSSRRNTGDDCDDPRDADYTLNLGGWNTRLGRRPVTRSMTRGASSAMQSRVMTLRSSRR